MYLKKLDEIDANFNHLVLGIERYVKGIWALHMYRHHVFRVNLSDSLVKNVNKINASLEIPVVSIDLNDYKDDFRSSESLNNLIEENEYPLWIWVYGIEALKDTNFSGWLRSRLTVRAVENLRVVFVVDSFQDYRDVFCNHRAPFYQSTIPLQSDISD